MKIYGHPGVLRAAKHGPLRVLDSLPFVPVRLFWIDAPLGAKRGGHAHRTNWQLIVPMRGKVKATAQWPRYDVRNRLTNHTWQLTPGMTLFVPPLTWLDLKFMTAGCLAVLASEPYDADEYINDLDELKRLA